MPGLNEILKIHAEVERMEREGLIRSVINPRTHEPELQLTKKGKQRLTDAPNPKQ